MMSFFQSLSVYFYSTAIFLLFHILTTSLCLDNYVPLEVISLNCGSFGSQIQSYDGRNWTGDIGTWFVASNMDANSTVSATLSMDPSIAQFPYMTARVFYSKFTYTFNVMPGPKFVRLFFNPNSSYSELNAAESLLSVTSGNLTLLRNFSAFLTANYFGKPSFFKEFIVHVENHTLELAFSPSTDASGAHAFVNGIEVVSIPLKLYIDDQKPLPMVGYSSLILTLDNTYPLETAYRINVGGRSISPKEDTGMLRTWTTDDDYIFGADSGEQPYDLTFPLKYSAAVPQCAAPESVYRTARSMSCCSAQVNLNYNLSWSFQVDTGFLYVIRLHFCEVFREITKVNQRVFDIFINNQTAEIGADIIEWAGGYGTPYYRDYIVMIPQTREGKQDLWLELHPNVRSRSQYYDSLLNGAEIFKVSGYDGNLAGSNPPKQGAYRRVSPTTVKSSWKSRKRVFIIIGCLFTTLITIVFIALLWINKMRDGRKKKESNGSLHCYNFSISEIKIATNNFDKARIIGSGGFGVVYKGYINRGGTTTVAVKRGNQGSIEQCFHQFNTEITTLCHLRHCNILALIGCCSDDHEMILVCEFMPNGTLFEHLHLVDQPQRSPLSWKQRLGICIGAAQGLHYLHSGTEQSIIHRDIKSTNILIDNNLVAKVSDFGLSKVCPDTASNNNISISIKGSVGYIDPEYYRHYKLTEKSDVYSFGVVLLEVLSARSVVNPMGERDTDNDDGQGGEDQESLIEWALGCLENGELEKLVDSHLRGNINPASLTKFIEIAQKCLADRCMDRPSMGEVVRSLELALQLLDHNESFLSQSDQEKSIDTLSNLDVLTVGEDFSEIMMPMGR